LENFPADLDALNALPFDDSLTIAEKVTEQMGVIGEKVEVDAYENLEAPMVSPYIHMGNRAAVLVGLSVANDDYFEAGRDVAMQVAAMKPIAVNEEGVDSSIVEKEIEIGKEQARQEGKPEQMLEKIAQGKLKKFFKESTLLHQAFVKDSKKSVQQYLTELNGAA
jgi:elongation factor Ts